MSGRFASFRRRSWAAAPLLAVASALAAVAWGSGSEPSEPPLVASNVHLDLDPASSVLLVWMEEGAHRRAGAASTAGSPAYEITRHYVANLMGCRPTAAEVARAIAVPESGACGFGLKPAFDRREEIESLLASVAADREAIAERAARRAGQYLPAVPRWKVLPVRFVLASQSMFDAVTLDGSAGGDTAVTILVNVSEVLGYGDSLGARREVLEHVLAHEVFHAGLRERASSLQAWREYPWNPADPIGHIARVMLEEGVAHYVDWKGRGGADTLFTERPGERERHSFSQLTRACKHLTGAGRSPSNRTEILQLAGTGPLWSKYGAISGMFAAFRIERARGQGVLREAVEGGPKIFLQAYKEVAAADTALIRLPIQLESLQ